MIVKGIPQQEQETPCFSICHMTELWSAQLHTDNLEMRILMSEYVCSMMAPERKGPV